MESHFDSCSDLAESFFLHVEAHGVMMVAFGLWFHESSGKILQMKMNEYKIFFEGINIWTIK